MKHRVLFWMLIACLAGWAVPLHAFERSVVEKSVVRIINKESRGVSSGSGTVINEADGLILTNHHVIADSQSLFVLSEFSDVEHEAEVVWKSREKDLAIIQGRGLRLPAAVLFTGELKEDAVVAAMGYPGAAGKIKKATQTRGNISHFLNGTEANPGWEVRAIQHTATVTGGNSGGPLFDNCGRVVGVNTARPHIMTRGGRVPDNAQINWASHIKEAINILNARGIDFSPDGSPCVSAAAAGAEAAAAAKETAVEAKESVRLTNTLVAVVTVVALAALGLALRKPRQEIIRVAGQVAGKMAEPLSRLSQSVRRKKPAIALTGFDVQGRKVAIKLSRADLNQQQGGFTVGRHPLLVDHALEGERLSRRHARFSGSNGSIFVEDLNSSNGTSVNGTACPPFQPVQIQPGDMVDVGGIALRVSS